MLDKIFIDQFLKVTEKAACNVFSHIGKGDKIAADQAAVNGMREQLNTIDMNGKIVIGEGELDEAPMLFIGENVGTKKGQELDIAVDPLEGTNFVSKNLPNSLSVLAVAKKGDLLQAPETYMEKIAIGPKYPENLVDLDYSVEKNIELLAKAKNTTPNNLVACVLKRPRHDKIVKSLDSLNVKINFITDGDVAGVLLVADPKSKVDIYFGIGGGPEGVLAGAALSCLNSQMQTRLIFQNTKEKERAKNMGITDFNKKYNLKDMIKGDVIFCATGITNGDLVSGVKDMGNVYQTQTLVLHKNSKTHRKIINKINK